MNLDFSWRVKGGVSDEGSFVGIASPYSDPPDYQNDVVAKGAFTQSIRQQPPQGYPLLWCHSNQSPIGTARIEDSGPGLLVKGQLLLALQSARDALVAIKGGAARGISIGFLPPVGDKVEYRPDGVRVLKEIHLVELSVVPVPAASRAQIVSVKTLGDVQHVLETIKDATEPEVAVALRGIDAELKRLLFREDSSAKLEEAAREELALMKSFAAELKKIA